MSPIIKKSQHRGKDPIARTLFEYLEREEGRDACLLLDASGDPITAEELSREFGGDRAAHWHSIVSPTVEDCSILTERHGGDRKAAAIAQGKAIAQRLERDTGQRIAYAVHFEERDGKPHFHYHFVGQGEARVRLYGRSGVIQRAWDRAWSPDQKPIQNWEEHRAFKATRDELRAVQREMRNLGEERRRAIAGAPPERKQEVRESFKDQELTLVVSRYELEVKAIDHRYSARNDLGSDRHQAELVDAMNRQKGAITRVHHRGLPREALMGSRSGRLASGLATAATSHLQHGVRGALRGAETALTVNGGSLSRSLTAPIAPSSEIALAVARTTLTTAARTAVSLAMKAASANPPGLVVQLAKLVVNAPQKLLGLVLPDQGKLPQELALPLRAASAVPVLGIVAKVATIATQETLRPILKETER